MATGWRVTHVELHHPELDHLLREPTGAIWKTVEHHGDRVLIEAKVNAPRDTGKGAASIRKHTTREGDRVVCSVSSPLEYMGYQEWGTGIHAGKGLIFPKRAKVLVFTPKHMRAMARQAGSGRVGKVFARYVRGVKATHWLTKALVEAQPWPVRHTKLSRR